MNAQIEDHQTPIGTSPKQCYYPSCRNGHGRSAERVVWGIVVDGDVVSVPLPGENMPGKRNGFLLLG